MKSTSGHIYAWTAIILLLFAPAIQVTDALGAQKVDILRSHGKVPDWAIRTPETDETYLYFVGRASGAPSLEAAENDAAADVIRQIVTAIGLEASFSYDRLRGEADLLLTDRLELAGDSKIIGLKRLETYFEKQIVSGEDSVKTSWNAHVLARYPVESLEQETARLEHLSASRVSSAESLLAESRELEDRGFTHRAWEATEEALGITGSLNVVADPVTSSRLAIVRQHLVNRARELSIPLRKITVEEFNLPEEIEENGNGTTLIRVLETTLADKGFVIERSTEAAASDAVPVVKLELNETTGYKLEPGFHFSRWNASLSISRPGSGSVLYGEVYPVKGFGVDQNRAALDAMRKLRLEVFTKFADETRMHFDSMLSREEQTGMTKAF